MASAAKDSPTEDVSVSDRVVSLLHDAQMERDSAKKVEHLRKVQEFIIHQDPYLLDNLLDEMLAFMNDPLVDVRKFVLSFILEASRKDASLLPKVLPNVNFMLTSDQNVNVLKKVISTASTLYPILLSWLTKSKSVSNEAEHCWQQFGELKSRILPLIDADNEGVRTHTIKFTETCILVQSCKTAQSEGDGGISLADVARDHRLLSYRQLEAEGRTLLRRLLDLSVSPSVSSVNLMTCMGSLAAVARQRPEHMDAVVVALETVHVNLPPTLAKSQVTSVRKALKMHLLALLRHEASSQLQPQITTLLTDLGATQAQVIKALPANSELRKRMRRTREDDDAAPSAKKAREEEEDKEEEDDEKQKNASAIDITAQFLLSKLNVQSVADLVMLTMVVLPDEMPPQFQSSYTPIAAAGTEGQVRHLARLMGTQLTAAGVGPGVEQVARETEQRLRARLAAQSSAAPTPVPKHSIETVVGGVPSEAAGTPPANAQAPGKTRASAPVYGVAPTAKASKRLQQFGLAHITQPMDVEVRARMIRLAFERIMDAEKRALQGGAAAAQQKLLVRLAVRLGAAALADALEAYVLAEQKARADLAVLWLHEASDADDDALYDQTLCRLLGALHARGEHKESLFHKLLLEAPRVTPAALQLLHLSCTDAVYGAFGMTTLRELILTRPRQRAEFLRALLQYAIADRAETRAVALQYCKELYQIDYIRPGMHAFVERYLNALTEAAPPAELLGGGGSADVVEPSSPSLEWDEASVKRAAALCLHLMPTDHSLIHSLAAVYARAANHIKRVLLRTLESPVNAMGMQSKQLLSLVEDFPVGAETLVTRIVHLLTDRNPPSSELVESVKKLYKERLPDDIRCLIPVLAGLEKHELVAALPKLVRLNPNVVKEVFNRILFGKSLHGSGQSPMNAAELLVHLHQLDTSSNDDLKAVVSAMKQLEALRSVYTKEVMAAVVQQLLDQTPLPTLLMRTIFQTLGAYPTLIGFVMNVLQRLVVKQVWTDEKLWEGFVRCCQRTAPHSFQVLLQLPPAQLRKVFRLCPDDVRPALKQHVLSLPAQQQAHISRAIIDLLAEELADEEAPTTTEEGLEAATMEAGGGGLDVLEGVSAVTGVGGGQAIPVLGALPASDDDESAESTDEDAPAPTAVAEGRRSSGSDETRTKEEQRDP